MTKRGSHQVERLESALSGALRCGDAQADELVRLSRLTARQKRVLWQAFILLKRGKYDAALVALEAALDPEAAR